jgi:hypothetical protein
MIMPIDLLVLIMDVLWWRFLKMVSSWKDRKM